MGGGGIEDSGGNVHLATEATETEGCCDLETTGVGVGRRIEADWGAGDLCAWAIGNPFETGLNLGIVMLETVG